MRFKHILPYVVLILLTGCAELSGKHAGGLICINCEPENKGYTVILAPVTGECSVINSKLSVDEAAARIKRKFNFMTLDEMKSSPNGAILLSSTEYGWSATPGTHYMMRKSLTGGFAQAEVTKKGTGSIIDIKTAVHVKKGDDLELAKKSANDLALEFRKRIISSLGK